MQNFLVTVPFVIILSGLVNLIRMTIFLVGSDIYTIRQYVHRKKQPKHFPKISIVIPAFNEEKSIATSVLSAQNSNYPQDKLQVIVVNDGSTDRTEHVATDFISANRHGNTLVVSQPNLGKAHALNNAIKNFATGELVMCLDADSYIDRDALMRGITYFEDKKVMAVASNVKVTRTKGILNLVQVYEYIVSYQMKKAQTAFNIEYIIGGVGSIFRKNFLEIIDYYDANTVTEDIDVTMKVLRHGNKNVRVVYGSDVIAYTQGALTVPDLIKQRHRWKWGRYQTFLKNRDMFFSFEKKHSMGFSWFQLPFALCSDLAFFFEPFVLLFMLYLIVGYGDIVTLVSAFLVISFYTVMNILGDETIPTKEKCKLISLAPLMYFLLYILSFVEYLALIKALWKLPRLQQSLARTTSNWQPISRAGLSLNNVS